MGAELLLLLMRMGAAGEIPVPLKNTDQPAAAALISIATAVMTKALLIARDLLASASQRPPAYSWAPGVPS